jgi:hypothetical protein
MGRANILKAAWLAILLGIGMERVLLAVAAGFGKMPSAKPIVPSAGAVVSAEQKPVEPTPAEPAA